MLDTCDPIETCWCLFLASDIGGDADWLLRLLITEQKDSKHESYNRQEDLKFRTLKQKTI